VFIADTDAEAKRRALEGGIGYCWQHYLWPIWERFDLLSGSSPTRAPGRRTSTSSGSATNVWIVGSPETCIRKLNELFEFTGSRDAGVVSTDSAGVSCARGRRESRQRQS
jgi:alkanesulfonate monooxygenase SsuD/methylene tetrahydromethanopterin reductase-like flavin-dependent oxidoreductase (luciferase family)